MRQLTPHGPKRVPCLGFFFVATWGFIDNRRKLRVTVASKTHNTRRVIRPTERELSPLSSMADGSLDRVRSASVISSAGCYGRLRFFDPIADIKAAELLRRWSNLTPKETWVGRS